MTISASGVRGVAVNTLSVDALIDILQHFVDPAYLGQYTFP